MLFANSRFQLPLFRAQLDAVVQRRSMAEISHGRIDARLLRLTEAVVRRLDAEPVLRARLSENVARWTNRRLQKQWRPMLALPWAVLRRRLLARTERGAALRQDAPLGGILPPDERMRIMREFAQ